MLTFALFGLSVTRKAYPLFVHFPLWVLLVLLLGVPKLQAAVPAKLPYSETELCALLSNGLENAVQAAARVEQPAERKVSVHMGIHGENFMVQIENTFSGEIFWQDGLPCTDVEAHGMGTRSIRSIVRSYGGEALFQVRDDRFRIRMMLPNKQETQCP